MYQFLVLNIGNNKFQSLLIYSNFITIESLRKKMLLFYIIFKKGIAGLKESSIALKGENFFVAYNEGQTFYQAKKASK